jgi:beta-mannanase
MKNIRKISLIITFTLIFYVIWNVQGYGLDYWAIFNDAEVAMSNGQYDVALEKYGKVIDDFKKSENSVNMALIYGRMAKCQAELSLFDAAGDNWMKEAEYWKSAGREQERISAERKAGFVSTRIEIYSKVSSQVAGNDYYNGQLYEPVLGIYLGAYAECDSAVQDIYGKSYITEFPKLTEKKHAAYMLYLTYGMNLSTYKTHIDIASQEGVALQIALEPLDGLDEVEDDNYLRSFAKEVSNVDIPIFIRFANEMNDPTSLWFVEPDKYIEKFRIVADVLHEEAPNAVVVWAPNMFPPTTIADYYPGDDYVDWVGISMYKVFQPELDPLGENIDRESYVEKLDDIYNLYADRKPIFISEGAVSYTNYKNGKDITDWSSQQLNNFYSFMPMLYPKIKAVFYFDSNNIIEDLNIYRNYMLSKNEIMLNTYNENIKSDYYLSSIGDESPIFYANVEQYGLAPKLQELSSYVKTPDPNVKRVKYEINSELIGTSNSAPWSISFDFSKFAGKNININVKAYNENDELISEKIISIYVGSANIEINGENIDLNSQAKNTDGRTYLSIRSLVEASGGSIEWNDVEKSFLIIKGSKKLKMSIGSKDVVLNGQCQTVAVEPFIFNSRSYLPLRYICEEILEYNVEWNNDTKTVVLTN